jgi:hypothetical protein
MLTDERAVHAPSAMLRPAACRPGIRGMSAATAPASVVRGLERVGRASMPEIRSQHEEAKGQARNSRAYSASGRRQPRPLAKQARRAKTKPGAQPR